MNFYDIIDMYSPAFIQDFLTVLGLLEKEGITLEQARELGTEWFRNNIMTEAEQKKENEKLSAEFKYNSKRCPSCGGVMSAFPVNHHPSMMVGESWKMSWLCRDIMGCGEQEYSENTVEEEMEKHGLGRFVPGPPPEIKPNRRRINVSMRQTRPRQFRIKNI